MACGKRKTHFFSDDALSWMSPVRPPKAAGALLGAPALASKLARFRLPGAGGGATAAVPTGGAELGGGRRPDCRSIASSAMGSDGTAAAGG